MTRKITVLLADDEAVARAGIRSILSQAEDIEIVGEAQDGCEAQRLVAELQPQVLLLDYKMPGPRPADLQRWARTSYPQMATLVLTAHDHESHLATMKEAGAAGYLTKNISENALIDSVRRAALGMACFDEEQTSRTEQWIEEVGRKWESLSQRERDVLRLVTIGAGTRYIAELLSLSPRTVEDHVQNILGKLKMESRQQAAAWMVRNLPDEMGEDKLAT